MIREPQKHVDMSIFDQSILSWVLQNNIRNERGDPIEFDKHYFLLEPMGNWNPKQCTVKSAQVGWSTISLLKSLYFSGKTGGNVIYTLPTFDFVKDFVPAKVNMMVKNNETLNNMIKDANSVETKQVNDGFIWYRGTHTERAAISHTSDLNIYDEYDSSDKSVVDMYASRLQYSEFKGEWYFSNPLKPSTGIMDMYMNSDQRRWIIKCSRCNANQSLDFWENVNREHRMYVCSNCHRQLREEDRHDGEWVPMYPKEPMNGYHINQLMCPWVSAEEILHLEKTKDSQYFYNMVLGLPFAQKDEQVDASLIQDCITDKKNMKLRNAMGVDVGYESYYYVLGNHEGIFETGMLTSLEEVEKKKKQYGARIVIDALPDFSSRRLPERHKGQAWCAFYKKDKQKRDVVEFGDPAKNPGYVYVDRNRAIQQCVDMMKDGEIKFNMHINELSEFIKHWENMYKVIEENRDGIQEAKWEHSGADHLVHAMVYFTVALTKTPKETPFFDNNSITGVPLGDEIIGDTIPADKIPVFEEQSQDVDWRYI